MLTRTLVQLGTERIRGSPYVSELEEFLVFVIYVEQFCGTLLQITSRIVDLAENALGTVVFTGTAWKS